jgi:dTDP-4-dehydrorhamnose 3,5-epimerase
MIFKPLKLDGAYLINLEKKEDERGFFARYYCDKEFSAHGLNTEWLQINNSYSKHKGTLRGLHFQYPPFSEVKLIRCIKGAIWDVIVDIRKDSKTYGEWYAAKLSDDNRAMMYVPKGFAHGFISLTDESEILYLVSSEYNSDSEGTLKWDDQFHQITWPIKPQIISEKDQNTEKWELNKSIVFN